MLKKLILFILLLNLNIISYEGKIFVTSIPKCGTHLLLRTIELITNQEKIGLPTVRWDNNLEVNNMFELYDILDCFLLISNKFLWYHVPYTKERSEILKRNNIKTFFIYRDPRDQQLSMFHWLNDRKNKGISFSEFGKKLINGSFSWPGSSILNLYEIFLPWQHEKHVYTTTFEKLVGPEGGGSLELQLQEIKNIASFLDYHLSDEDIITISKNIYGSGNTFKFGKIGTWKKYYKEEHKDALKQTAGNLLIKLKYENNLFW